MKKFVLFGLLALLVGGCSRLREAVPPMTSLPDTLQTTAAPTQPEVTTVISPTPNPWVTMAPVVVTPTIILTTQPQTGPGTGLVAGMVGMLLLGMFFVGVGLYNRK